MKILTLNTWQERGPWRARWRLILKGLSRHNPEIVGFQEVFNPVWAEEIKKKAGYRYLVFNSQPGGLMFLSRYPVLASETLTLKTQSPTEDYLRYALFAKLRMGGQEIALFNTHLSWRTPETKIRQKQVEELGEWTLQKAQNLPTFVMGDFNAAPSSLEIKRMSRIGRFADVFKAKHPGKGGLTWNNKNPFTAGSSVPMPDRRIDYIWLRDLKKSFTLRRAELVYERPHGGLYPSDHFGVLAEFENKRSMHDGF